jgi:hypothetical protein
MSGSLYEKTRGDLAVAISNAVEWCVNEEIDVYLVY